MNDESMYMLMFELAKVMDKKQASEVCAVMVLEKKEQKMIEYLKEKKRTVDEVVDKMIELLV